MRADVAFGLGASTSLVLAAAFFMLHGLRAEAGAFLLGGVTLAAGAWAHARAMGVNP